GCSANDAGEATMNDRSSPVRNVVALFVLAGIAAVLPIFASEFAVSMALTCLMYVALASSWGLFCGTTRYLSLATSAFFGIGAYTAALLLDGLPWLVVIAVGSA